MSYIENLQNNFYYCAESGRFVSNRDASYMLTPDEFLDHHTSGAPERIPPGMGRKEYREMKRRVKTRNKELAEWVRKVSTRRVEPQASE